MDVTLEPMCEAPLSECGVAFQALERGHVWRLFETPQGDPYALWEHANIADHKLFDEGTARLAREARDLSEPGDRLAAATAPEVAAAVGGTRP